MGLVRRPHFVWRVGGRAVVREIVLGERTLVMGILNVTPDSFSDGALYLDPVRAVDHAQQMVAEGADLLDLGAESTRPGAVAVSAGEEWRRLGPVLRGLRGRVGEALLSVDTYHASTARLALGEGAEVVNDVSGLTWDAGMAGVMAASGCGAVLMHTRGTPAEWGELEPLGDVVGAVTAGLRGVLDAGLAAGVREDAVVLDPGFGFGKMGEENFDLLAGMSRLHALGRPLLIGLSRKRFLAGRAEERQAAGEAAHVAAILQGAHILRVHDVAGARVSCGVGDAILRRV